MAGWEKVAVLLVGIFVLSSSMELIAAQTIPLIWNVNLANSDFVGREGVLKELKARLGKTSYKVLALVGNGGVGKTQVAKEYANQYKANYDIVWWFKGTESLEAQYIRLAEEWNKKHSTKRIGIALLAPDKIVEEMKDKLRVTNKRWLLIFDDIWDNNSVSQYIPEKHNKSVGHVLMTSRDAALWSDNMKIDKFTREESIGLLLKMANSSNREEANKLAEVLQDYPLAIAQAGAYIRANPGLDIGKYMALYIDKKEELWGREKVALQAGELDGYQKLIDTTMLLSIEEIKRRSEKAYQLLVKASFLDDKEIPEVLLKVLVQEGDKDKVEDIEAIAILERYSLLERNKVGEGATFSMHQVVQSVLQHKLSDREKKGYLEGIVQTFLKILPKGVEPLGEYLALYPSLLAQAKKIFIEAETKELWTQELAELSLAIGNYYAAINRSLPEETEKWFKKIDMVMNKVLVSDKEFLVRFYTSKSRYYWSISENKRAVQECDQALSYINSKTPNWVKLDVYNFLAQLYIRMGDVINAKKYMLLGERVLRESGQLYNQDALYGAMADVYAADGDFEKALYWVDMSLKDASTIPGAALLAFILPKAEILVKMGRYKEAQAILDQAASKIEETMGDNEVNHYSVWQLTLQTLIDLGLGHKEKAMLHAKKSLDIAEKLHASDEISSLKAFAHETIADVYAATGHLQEAHDYYTKADTVYYKLYQKVERDDLSDLFAKMAILGARMKRADITAQYLEQHLRHFGGEHHRTKLVLDYLKSQGLDVPVGINVEAY